MPTLKFSDGISFNTDGPYRVEHRRDGYYVVGRGMLTPVDSQDDGDQFIAELTAGTLIKKGIKP
jgi:hypothetical protein